MGSARQIDVSLPSVHVQRITNVGNLPMEILVSAKTQKTMGKKNGLRHTSVAKTEERTSG